MSNLSRRSLIAGAVFLMANTAISQAAFAHDKPEHNKELERVLLGQEFSRHRHPKGDQARDAIDAIEAASYLCIDQFNNHGEKELQVLRDYGVAVPDISEINPEGVNAKSHREYTHCGWDVSYKDDKANWERRKILLLDTVNKVFNFNVLPSWIVGYDERCDSFAALIYYVHILGDFLEGDTIGKFTGETNGKKVSFAKSFPTDKTPDIFWELDNHLGVLFMDQKYSHGYQSLLSDLKDIARDARRLGNIEDADDFSGAYGYAEKLMALLTGDKRVHNLLMKEDYFKNVFENA